MGGCRYSRPKYRMQRLSKIHNCGRKRLHPRVEELVEINVQALVTNKPDAKHTAYDIDGNRIDFIDEMSGEQMVLAVYINKVRQGHFPLVERAIPGRISNPVPDSNRWFYYVVVDGRRYKRLYVDAVRKRIGSRDSLRAVYSSDSVGPKQLPTWRALQKARKMKVWSKNRRP